VSLVAVRIDTTSCGPDAPGPAEALGRKARAERIRQATSTQDRRRLFAACSGGSGFMAAVLFVDGQGAPIL
jgi:hypothetical protein